MKPIPLPPSFASNFSLFLSLFSHLHTPGRCPSRPSRCQGRRLPACTLAACPQTTRKRRRCAETEEVVGKSSLLLLVPPASCCAFPLSGRLNGRGCSCSGDWSRRDQRRWSRRRRRALCSKGFLMAELRRFSLDQESFFLFFAFFFSLFFFPRSHTSGKKGERARSSSSPIHAAPRGAGRHSPRWQY